MDEQSLEVQGAELIPPQEALFGRQLYHPAGELLNIEKAEKLDNETLSLFLRILSGREEPLQGNELNIREVNGEKRLVFPMSDKALVWDSRVNEERKKKKMPVFSSSLEITEATPLILPDSLTAYLDTMAVFTAKKEVFSRLKKEFPSSEEVKTRDGRIIALIVPGSPQLLARPVDEKGGKWQTVDIASEKNITGLAVVIDPDIKPEDLPELVWAMRQASQEHKLPAWEENLYLKFRFARQMVERYQEMVDKLTLSDFDQDYQGNLPSQEEFNQMKEVLTNIIFNLKEIERRVAGFLSDEERQVLENISISSEDYQQFLSFSQQDLANRLYRLGIKKEKINELLPEGQKLSEDFFTALAERRVPPEKLAHVFHRYGRWLIADLFSPESRFSSFVSQLSASFFPKEEIINLLAERAFENLLKYLDLPDEVKNLILERQEAIPENIRQWLEKEGFKKRLDELRQSLWETLSCAAGLSGEKKEQYQKIREAWSGFISQRLNERRLIKDVVGFFSKITQSDFQYKPQVLACIEEYNRSSTESSLFKIIRILGQLYNDDKLPQNLKQEFKKIISFYDNFPLGNDFSSHWQEFLKEQGSSFDQDLLPLMEKEQNQRWQLAREEKGVIEQILNFQRKYPGWNEELKGRFWAFLETSPLRILIDKELSCIGRQGLSIAILEELGFSDQIYTASTYSHSFVLIEDSFGLSRVVEPSGHPFHSYYLRKEREKGLFYLSRHFFNQHTLREEMQVGNFLERVNIVKGQLNFQISALINFIISDFPNQAKLFLINNLLVLNEERDDLWDIRAFCCPSVSHPDYIRSSLRVLELNSWFSAPFARLVLPNGGIDSQIGKIEALDWGEDFSPQEIERMIKTCETMIEELRISLADSDERNTRWQIKRQAIELDWTKDINNWGDKEFDKAVEKLERLKQGLERLLESKRGKQPTTTPRV